MMMIALAAYAAAMVVVIALARTAGRSDRLAARF